MLLRWDEWKPQYQRESTSDLLSWAPNQNVPETTQQGIRKRLLEAEEDMTSLTTEISTVARYLTKLQEQQQRDNERITILHAGIAPIKRLPAEILGEIFSHCTQKAVMIPQERMRCTSGI